MENQTLDLTAAEAVKQIDGMPPIENSSNDAMKAAGVQ